ncbi:hypothetical protein JTB14_029523 [Gonioctena quinquepunctata]|nr:hypothetical protein JTB14_029523 [Gonioctena quinquepunctata]
MGEIDKADFLITIPTQNVHSYEEVDFDNDDTCYRLSLSTERMIQLSVYKKKDIGPSPLQKICVRILDFGGLNGKQMESPSQESILTSQSTLRKKKLKLAQFQKFVSMDVVVSLHLMS